MPVPLTPGSDFGPYRVIEPLGKGGMSSVYRAYEQTLDREIALKVLPAQFLHDPSFSERFEREAKVVARLEHRNIVPIHAFGVDEQIPWMAMRLVSGESAASLRAAGPLPPERVIAILRDVAEAIDYAHSRGVLHRDVKPQNILLDEDGHAYLADFGIARIVAGADESTQTGTVMGTPKYMAPEQARGETIDHRCDIYSLGVVAYELFTGSVPFSGTTPMNIAVKHIMDPVPEPDPELLPAPLAAPVLKCLAKQPKLRWDSGLAFVDALAKGLEKAPAESGAPKPQPDVKVKVEDRSRPPTPLSPPPPPPLTPPPARTRTDGRTPTRPVATTPRDAPVESGNRRAMFVLLGGAGAVMLAGVIAAWNGWVGSDPAPEPVPELQAPVSAPLVPAVVAPPLAEAAAPPRAQAAATPPLTAASAATLALFQRVCDEGDAITCEKLAQAYWEGQARPGDRARAPDLFGRACDGGVATSCAFLAGLYRDGDGVLRNMARAVALYDQACAAGSVDGCYELALLYRTGEGVGADEARARELLRQACDAGSSDACAALTGAR